MYQNTCSITVRRCHVKCMNFFLQFITRFNASLIYNRLMLMIYERNFVPKKQSSHISARDE